MRSTCSCPCEIVHPQRLGICEVAEPVTTRLSLSLTLDQVVRVPYCRPCADELDALRGEFGKPVESIRKEPAS